MKNHPLSKIKFLAIFTSIFFSIFFVAFSIFTPTTFAQDVEAAPIELHGPPDYLAGGNTYRPITPGTDGVGGFLNFGGSFEQMLQRLFEMGVMITVILAVIMIIWGGVEYMGSESVFAKGEGRDRIKFAIWGLMIALISILLISTILPGGTGGTFEINIFG